MEFDQVIKKRRSTRVFKSDAIADEEILKIVEAARTSPSAANRQPWQFIITKGDTKNAIADIMEKRIRWEDIKDIDNPTKPYTAISSLYYSIKAIRQAPIMILTFREKNDDWIFGDYLSIGSAIEHMHLKATDLGLGSLWLRDIIFSCDEIAKYVGMENKELVVALIIGYPNEEIFTRKCKTLEEISKWYD